MVTVKTNMQGYVKDTQTGVVTNIDAAALNEHRNKVSKAKEIKRLTAKVEELETRIKRLEEAPTPIGSWLTGNGPLHVS